MGLDKKDGQKPNALRQCQTFFDDRNQVYQTKTFAVSGGVASTHQFVLAEAL